MFAVAFVVYGKPEKKHKGIQATLLNVLERIESFI